MLVDEKCLMALKRISMDKAAEHLAKVAKETGAAEASTTLGFLEDDEQSTGPFIATLTITVKKA